MRLTSRQLNRSTLARQLLLDRAAMGVADAVHQVVALQAQEPASPYLALWNRLADLDAGDVDAAFIDRTVIRSSLMRLTLHAVHVTDHPAFHRAMVGSLRGSRLNDRRYTSTGLTTADADGALDQLTSFAAAPRSSGEISELLAGHIGERAASMWWALRRFAPLHHVPTGGPWSFRSPSTFVTAREVPGPDALDESLGHLVLRYLAAFGPASAQDIAQFTILRSPVIKQVLRERAGTLEQHEGPDGTMLYDRPGAPIPDEDIVAPPRLLPMWDSVLLAYADRSRIIPPAHRSLVIRRNGDVLPTLLVDGHVAGIWRAVDGGIEATAFERLDSETWEGLAAEATALVAFLADRDPLVYRRYHHWWAKDLPSAEIRLLSG